VSYSLLLLTAGWLAGQTPSDPAAAGHPTYHATSWQAAPNGPYGDAVSEHPGLFGRLRNLLHPQELSGEYVATAPVAPPSMTTEEPPPAAVETAAYKARVPPVQKQFQDRVGTAEDYRWITGQLFYLHTGEGGAWVVRYGAVDQVDRYGGSVVLATGLDMKNYREGDLVCVEGEVLADRKAPGHLGGALYRATSIAMITRGDK
jgi:hypothetical protein